ncbi:MAG: HAD-IIIA family hydrolase [Mojavia pulchra JT2-VF2]|jgi:D-glycero-D-manno-heptose 1,7-bisphosphate phosphatase|uniref:HAD-IIIA family hydrolase n=1 Tax=Mojavia pulchra JT2-VF2 TaxID=287848 RepID=A0A951UH58_9NOST|nr:HAD-IIIA family hydrolase [Mojavia pulchra JT2-VF2]
MSLLLIDLDGTIREPLSGEQYFQHPQDQKIIMGAEVAIGTYKDDWIIVGITNQGGVAAGYKSIQECVREQQYTLELFPELREIYFCPDFEGKKCFRVTRHNVHNHSKTKWSGQYRKPGAGMLQLAMIRHKHTPQNSCYVGDRPEDEAAARRAGVHFQWAKDWIEQHQATIISQLAEI